jgi:hypothetical protein
MIELKIDVTKIPKDKIFEGAKGKYLDIVVSKRQQPDNYGNTHTVYIKTKSKEEEKIYIGSGVGKFEDAAPTQNAPATGNTNASNDVSYLPF